MLAFIDVLIFGTGSMDIMYLGENWKETRNHWT